MASQIFNSLGNGAWNFDCGQNKVFLAIISINILHMEPDKGFRAVQFWLRLEHATKFLVLKICGENCSFVIKCETIGRKSFKHFKSTRTGKNIKFYNVKAHIFQWKFSIQIMETKILTLIIDSISLSIICIDFFAERNEPLLVRSNIG